MSWRNGWSGPPAPGARASARSCATERCGRGQQGARCHLGGGLPGQLPRGLRGRGRAGGHRPVREVRGGSRADAGARQERPGVHVYLPEGRRRHPEEDARVKLYLPEPKSLSQILPYFHNLGLEVLDERPFEIVTADRRDFFLYDLGLKYPAGVEPLATGQLLAESFGAAVSGAANPTASTGWCCVKACTGARSLSCGPTPRYMRQMGNTNSFGFIADTLLANPHVTRALTPCSRPGSIRRSRRADRSARKKARAELAPASSGRHAGRGPRAADLRQPDRCDAAHQLLPGQAVPELQAEPCRASRACRSRGPSSKSGSIRRGSKACTCGSARWPAAACAGPTGGRTSGRKSWGWSRPRPSRTR